MATESSDPHPYDGAMVHHFIRLVGRAPTADELGRFRDLQSRLAVDRGRRRSRPTLWLLRRRRRGADPSRTS